MDFYAAVLERMGRQHGPLGDRLRNALTGVLESGVIAAGEALPSEREMAEHLNVSRSTLRQGLKELALQGLVATRPGAGTIVVGRIPKALSRLSGFTEDMQLRGLVATSRVLECHVAPVGADAAFRTGLPLGTPVFTLVRLRLAGGEPIAYERAMVPVEAVGADYDGSGSLYERMDARNARPRRVLQSLQATEADEALAHYLGIRPGAAVLEITQLGYGESGTVVEDAVSWYRGDRYKYVGEIRG
ncbi:MAG: GntR family transcriptional regulator [Devosia sp.]|uniref:GntR family transcriptional regulator n=1 Tax=Devosia sp. TaxID=1871048 RepID=UPI001ACFE009|nr:GntR family transcriptional regulator [Devosia sp.]MBN9315383.1 GntR family transcriptional regulator [Devosia sp.]